MNDRSDFCNELAQLNLSHVDRAVALLWYYRQSGEFEDRTAAELASDLHNEDFPRPRVSRLDTALAASRFTVRGARAKSFKLDLRRVVELDEKCGNLLKIKKIAISDAVIPYEWVSGTRGYLEKLVRQINGCYEYRFYDGCAVMCRRLMESLIIETYVSQNRVGEVQKDGIFVPLDTLIKHVCADTAITLARNSLRDMTAVKNLGDIAAHDRNYITHKSDIDDLKTRYRRVISELLASAKIVK